jgi:starvation-inducible DNA-binding protein
MKTNIGLAKSARAGLGEILNRVLADECVLYISTRDYHWNVTGPEFGDLHAAFEEQYEALAAIIDEVAEFSRALGESARGSWSQLIKATRLSARPGSDLAAKEMIGELLTLHEAMIVRLRGDTGTAQERHKDAGTADFLTALMNRHAKIAWMLRAQLA